METAEYKIRVAPIRAAAHIRKNHALEHATIHLLTQSKPGVTFAGYSFIKGYWILGRADALTDLLSTIGDEVSSLHVDLETEKTEKAEIDDDIPY